MEEPRKLRFRVLSVTAGVCLLLMFSQPGFAERMKLFPGLLPEGLTWDGSFRSRVESKSDFNFDSSDQGYHLTQFRLNLQYEPTDWLVLYLEGQDARVFNEDPDAVPPIKERAVPNIYADDLDVHQAYFDLKTKLGEVPLKLRTGRQKLLFGTERLVGPLEWVNTARVWDGVRLTAGKPGERTLEQLSKILSP